MLRILCGVAGAPGHTVRRCDWPVLRSSQSAQTSQDDVIRALSEPTNIHVFASTLAIQYFHLICSTLPTDAVERLSSKKLFACGVGTSTDTAAKVLTYLDSRWDWSNPLGEAPVSRDNGIAATLERLRALNLIPIHGLHLWTKESSTSEKILSAFVAASGWQGWHAQTHNIYTLSTASDATPTHISSTLMQSEPVCFAAKSAHVLSATINEILRLLQVSDVGQLPNNIFFAVWERSAELKAQQLGLQNRLIPWSDFHSQSTSDSD